MVSDSKNIALNYLRGWFVVDLLAAMPFDHLYARDLYNGEVSKILNANRIIPLAHTIAHFLSIFLYFSLLLSSRIFFDFGTKSMFRNPTFIW